MARDTSKHYPENTIRNDVFDRDGKFIYVQNNALDISAGRDATKQAIHKFGFADNIDSGIGFVDLWDGASVDTNLRTYTWSSTADIDRISSDDDTDTQDVEIQGLDTNWDLVVQTETLTGQTPVALTTPLIRVFRMKNVGATDFAGDVYCFVNVATTGGIPNTITNTRAIVQNGNNQTLMAIFSVPRNTIGFLNNSGFGLSKKVASFSTCEMKHRPFGGVFQLKMKITVTSTGTSHSHHKHDYPHDVDAKTDILFRADSSVNDNAVAGSFDILLEAI